MRVFVTGGTGAIGTHTVPALIAAGHTVSALSRSDAAAAALRRQGATPVQVSLFDRDDLTAAFAGHDVVANLASALPSTRRFLLRSAWTQCHRLRRYGSAAVVDAAVAAGVGRVIQESVVMIYRDGGDRWIDESWPTERYFIADGNHAAEDNARRVGPEAVILRFGMFYGPGAAHSEELLSLAGRHVGFTAGRPLSYMSSIQLADAADAVVAALTCPGGTYNIVDDEPVTARDNMQAMAAAVGAAPWLRGPGRAALLLGDRATSMTRSLRVCNARFRAATGWSPRYPSVREGYRAMARDLADR